MLKFIQSNEIQHITMKFQQRSQICDNESNVHHRLLPHLHLPFLHCVLLGTYS